jgi:hypothetical protein
VNEKFEQVMRKCLEEQLSSAIYFPGTSPTGISELTRRCEYDNLWHVQ